MPQHNNHNSAGFTLIEMLVVAPIVLLVIGGFIALMVSMIGDILATRDYNTMVYDTQDSLNRIEQDVRLSALFLNTTGTTSPQQGSDNNYSGTAPFTITSNNNMLLLSVPATDKNPVDATRQIINYANQPNPCGTTQTANKLLMTKIAYFVSNGSLWRRTILPPYDTNATPDNNTVCSLPWQQNSCVVGYASDGHCQTNDVELVKNVQSLTIQYFADPASTVDTGIAGAATATTINATITALSTTAGRNATTSQSVRATKLNSQSTVSDSTPSAPLTVTMQPSSKGVIASDTNITIPAASSISSASVLWQQSSDNGTTWQDIPGQSSATLLLQSIDMSWNNRQFRAIFSSGSDSVTTNTATLTVSLWGTLSNYQNGWGTSYVPPQYTGGEYTKTSAGLVMLKGLISGGSTTFDTLVTTLPIGYRPSSRMIFYVGSYNATATSAFGRVDVLPNGEVHFMNGNNTWVSLDSIKFLDTAATCTATTTLTLSNGWKNYAGYPALNLCKDTTGRIETNGLVYGGTTTPGTTIGTIPAGYQSSENLIVPAADGPGIFGSIGIYSSAIAARGMMTSYLSVNNSYIANNGAVTWQTPTVVNGMTNYGSGYAALQYGKTSDGLVMIKGLLKGGTVADGTTVFTLPSGYRPSSHMILSGVANQHQVRLDVNVDGTVVIQGAGDTAWTSFDALSFWSDGS